MNGILIVDSNPVQRDQLRTILNEAGYPVLGFAKSGAEAVKLLRSTEPSLIAMELVMPDMNGLDLIRSIRAAYPSVPVLACSSFSHEYIADMARRSGASAFFSKPYPAIRLLQEIERMIGPPVSAV